MDIKLPPSIDYWCNASNHDCYFIVGPEDGLRETIGTFKVFLVAHSEHFRSMLESGNIVEKEPVSLPGIDADIFKIFLKCIYGGSDFIIPHLSFVELAKLLHVTDKYLVNEIYSKVATHMAQILTFDHIFLALKYPVCLKEENLKNAIERIIQSNTDKLVQDMRFLELIDDALLFVLQQDKINTSEIIIWKAVLKWGINKANCDDGKVVRSHIIKHLKFIRFCAMKIDEFCKEVIPSEILLQHEAYEICKSFGTLNVTSLDNVCNNRQTRGQSVVSVFAPNTSWGMDSSAWVSNRSLVPKEITIPIQYSYIVQNVRTLGSTSSEPVSVQNYSFIISVYKKRMNKICNLGIFLKCECKELNWRCCLDVELFLINQCGKSNKCKKFTHTYSHRSTCLGFNDFCDWSTVLDPKQGFIKDSNIIVMAQIEMKYLPKSN